MKTELIDRSTHTQDIGELDLKQWCQGHTANTADLDLCPRGVEYPARNILESLERVGIVRRAREGGHWSGGPSHAAAAFYLDRLEAPLIIVP